jgi:hypothetical protein
MSNEFLIRKTGAKARAHLWMGDDTACRMWSTGGLKRSRFEVRSERGDHEICVMCVNNSAGEKHEN